MDKCLFDSWKISSVLSMDLYTRKSFEIKYTLYELSMQTLCSRLRYFEKYSFVTFERTHIAHITRRLPSRHTRDEQSRFQVCFIVWWCCSMQYEYEAPLVQFRASARPSWSRWQGADTVPHVVLWWHGSCLGKLRYPQKARQHWQLTLTIYMNDDIRLLCIFLYWYSDAARTHAEHKHADTRYTQQSHVRVHTDNTFLWTQEHTPN